MQALTDDDEWADLVAALPKSDQPGAPRMREWTPELEMLTNLYDRVGELIRVVAMTAGGKPKRPQPAPRPRTALDRARARQRKTQHRHLVSVLLPDAAEPPGAP